MFKELNNYLWDSLSLVRASITKICNEGSSKDKESGADKENKTIDWV